MKKQKKIVIVVSLLLFLVIAGTALDVVVLSPADFKEKRLLSIVLSLCSLLPVTMGVFLIRAMNAFSEEAQLFATATP